MINATDYVAPSIEILDTRIIRQDPATGQTRKIFDTISDNAANAGVILGDQKVAPGDIDLRWSGALLYLNDQIEASSGSIKSFEAL